MKICLILVDGMRPDALAQLEEAQALLSESQYTLTAKTVFPSMTLPCHMSLFHSVDPARHGTVTNIHTPQVRPINSLFDVLKAAGKNGAMFYDWEELRDVARPGSMAVSNLLSGDSFNFFNSNDMLTAQCIDTLKKQDIDFAFLYMGLTDNEGHLYGWMSEPYMDSIRYCLRHIDEVRKALGDEYLVLITADHGGHDRTHGSEAPEDILIPLIVCGNTDGVSFNLDNVSIKDLAPTVATLLGVAPDRDWEGKCLV